MNIILKNIPSFTLNHHIRAFLDPVLRGGFFRKKGNIEQISIYKNIIAEPNIVEYYALVNIEPDSVAQRVIDQLKYKKLNGKLIEVSEFYSRHWSNERRRCGVQIDVSLHGRRKGERRRKQTRLSVEQRENVVQLAKKI